MLKNDYTKNMSEAQKNGLINSIIEASQSSNKPVSRSSRTVTSASDRERAKRQMQMKEAILEKEMSTAGGLRKIAANLANPVRQKLDYKGIFRKFAVVELIPEGVPMIYDKDLPEATAVKVGEGGAPGMIDMRGERVEITPFEIIVNPVLPYAEMYNRRFRALDRMKDRLIEGMELREDLTGFALMETAAVSGGTTPQVVAGKLDRDTLAKGFAQVEQSRLQVAGVLMTAFGTMGLRRWQYLDLDQAGMQMIRETGYLGDMWGSSFYVNDQITNGVSYVTTTPKFSAWVAIKKDVDVIPADEPKNARLGFVGYLYEGMTWHNNLGICKVTFSATS